MDYYQEVMLALSESVMNNHLKRPWAKKSWWRHIRLAIKPCYLRNHASQIQSCYGTLSGSHGRSFRIRHEKSREAPSGDQITMTSYPACKKPRYLENHASQTKSYNESPSWSLGRLVIFIKKNQILFLKTYQFINFVNGVSHSHKTANIFFHLTQ